jgi:uncharacterized RDD family membrane protein YckC
MERYYAFWRRLGAGLFDGIILTIISLLCAKYIFSYTQLPSFALTVALSILPFLYSVLLTGLFGQTIGKIIMGVKVLDLGERKVIGIKRAILRDSVPIILQILSLCILGLHAIEVLSVTDEVSSVAESIISWTSFLWFIIELITMFLNRKRRAVHDLIASSVVISLKGLRFDKLDEELASKRSSSANANKSSNS